MIKKQIRSCLIVILGLLNFGFASAATLHFDPLSDTVNVGQPFDVNVVVSDLGTEVVSAYALDVTYDSSLLMSTGVVLNPVLGDDLFFEAFYGVGPGTAGVLDFDGLSLLSDTDLAILQPGESVVIASLSFMAIGVGVSPLAFVPDPSFGIDIKGRNGAILAFSDSDVGEGSVSVVPIPGAALLMLTGLLGIGVASRKRNKEA